MTACTRSDSPSGHHEFVTFPPALARELLEPVARFSKMRSINHLEEEQIQRSAEALVRTHGSNAAMVCAQTAERWIRRGDPAAAELWTRFMHACRKLLDEMPKRQDV